jgi:hypothetical protein
VKLDKIREKCKGMGSRELMIGVAKYAKMGISAQDRYVCNPIIQCATDEIDERRSKYLLEQEEKDAKV